MQGLLTAAQRVNNPASESGDGYSDVINHNTDHPSILKLAAEIFAVPSQIVRQAPKCLSRCGYTLNLLGRVDDRWRPTEV